MPYLKVEEYINAPRQELMDKLHEEFNEVIEEIDDPCSPVETLISELHDLAQICNTHIHRLCKVNNLDYDTEYKKHEDKIKSRGVNIER